jgi:23S rRNA (guanosine2251-2'-O)-methyltransferase
MKSISPVLILHNIRSAENVGSLFRTSDAIGIKHMYLAGITPSPLDRFNRPVPKIEKAALGSEKTIPWEKVDKIEILLTKLKQDGYQIIAIEQSPMSMDYKSVPVRHPVAFILGNEVEGIPHSILEQADCVAEIKMHGTKESLNVSVAGGIALFQMLGR